MKKRLHRGHFAFLLLILLISGICLSIPYEGVSAVQSYDALSPTYTKSKDRNHYELFYSLPVYSYLFQNTDGTYERLAYDGKSTLVLEYYDASFVLLEKKDIQMPLQKFGGAYEGKDNFYIVFGQDNTSENNNTEVFRIVKYTKNWQELGHASLYGENTTEPFEFGGCRMTESNGYLHIRTCHSMYQIDGVNHQANVQIQIRESDMAVTSKFTGVWNPDNGYASHSFNQYVLADSAGNIITLDHGDANPRALMLCKYNAGRGEGMYGSDGVEHINLMNFYGKKGANFTDCYIGGFEYASGGYMITGASTPQDGSEKKEDIFTMYLPDNNLSAPQIHWLTNDGDNKEHSNRTPQFVKFNDSKYLLMWKAYDYDMLQNANYQYMFVNGKGEKLTEVKKLDASISDCQPIINNQGKAVWYSGTESSLTFYAMSEEGELETVGTYPEMTEEPEASMPAPTATQTATPVCYPTCSPKLTPNPVSTATVLPTKEADGGVPDEYKSSSTPFPEDAERKSPEPYPSASFDVDTSDDITVWSRVTTSSSVTVYRWNPFDPDDEEDSDDFGSVKKRQKPSRGYIVSLRNKKGRKVVVKFVKDSAATWYEVRYSRSRKRIRNAFAQRVYRTKFTAKYLAKGRYYFQVRACNSAYRGKWSTKDMVQVRK